MDLVSRLQPLIGLVGILAVAYLLSTDRKAISARIVGWGLGLQVLFALIVLKTEAGIQGFQWLGGKIQELLHYSVEGSRFVFGPLGDVAIWSKVMNGALGAEGKDVKEKAGTNPDNGGGDVEEKQEIVEKHLPRTSIEMEKPARGRPRRLRAGTSSEAGGIVCEGHHSKGDGRPDSRYRGAETDKDKGETR